MDETILLYSFMHHRKRNNEDKYHYLFLVYVLVFQHKCDHILFQNPPPPFTIDSLSTRHSQIHHDEACQECTESTTVSTYNKPFTLWFLLYFIKFLLKVQSLITWIYKKNNQTAFKKLFWLRQYPGITNWSFLLRLLHASSFWLINYGFLTTSCW